MTKSAASDCQFVLTHTLLRYGIETRPRKPPSTISSHVSSKSCLRRCSPNRTTISIRSTQTTPVSRPRQSCRLSLIPKGSETLIPPSTTLKWSYSHLHSKAHRLLWAWRLLSCSLKTHYIDEDWLLSLGWMLLAILLPVIGFVNGMVQGV